MVRRHGRLRADLPFRTDKELKIPSRVYRPYWRDLDPYVEVESVTWQRGNLVIAGLAYVPSIDISKRRYTNKIVILRPRRKFRPPIVSLASSWRHPRATQISGQDRYDYAWAGFRCEISSRWFRIAGRWLTGDWDCFILVRGHGVWRPARLHSPALGDAGRPGVLEPVPGVQVRPTWVGRQLHVGVLRTPARLVSSARGGDDLALEVDLDPAGAGERGSRRRPSSSWPGRAAGPYRHSGAEMHNEGPALRVRGLIPLAALPGWRRAVGPVPSAAAGDGAAGWDLYLKPACRGRIRVTFPAEVAEAFYARGDREIAVERSRYGNVTLAERAPRPVLDEHSWSPEGSLLLHGTWRGPAGAALELVLRCPDVGGEYVIGCQRDGEPLLGDGRARGDADVRRAAAAARRPVGRAGPVRRRAGDAGRLRPRPAGRHLAQEGRGRAEAVRVHHRRVRLAGDHRRAAAAAVGAGQLQPAGAAPGAVPDPVAAPAAGRGPVRELERQAVHRQPARHRRRAAPPRGRPRAHLGGDRLRGRGPRQATGRCCPGPRSTSTRSPAAGT